MRIVGFLGAAAFCAIAVLGGAGGPVGAQVPTTTTPAVKCAKVQPTVIFLGSVTTIANDLVTFEITSVVKGTGSPNTTVTVEYPTEYNAQKLSKLDSYRVTATMTGGHLLSVVPTAQITACGQSTRHADGSAIDTSSLAGVKEQLPHDAARLGLILLAVLILLILLGRVFDRRSRYK